MSALERRLRRAAYRLEVARAGGCVPFKELSCFDCGIGHGCCESLLLDGFSVEEITAVGG